MMMILPWLRFIYNGIFISEEDYLKSTLMIHEKKINEFFKGSADGRL